MVTTVRAWLGDAIRDLRVRPPGNVPYLDALRALAILLVFTLHTADVVPPPRWFAHSPFVYYGWTGVDLFFVLSGLLIGTQLLRELDRTGSIRIGRFLLRRGLRIWPLYFAFVAMLGAEAVFFGRTRSGLWADALYVSNFFHHQISGSWSLSTEEQFYVIAPVLILVVARFLDRRYVWAPAALALPALAATRALVARQYAGMLVDQMRPHLYFPIYTHADGLAIGVLIAYLVVRHPGAVIRPRARWGLAFGAAALGAVVYAAGRTPGNFLALGLIYGSVVLAGLAPGNPPKAIGWRGFYVVSRLSYGIYLNHFGVLQQLEHALGTRIVGRFGYPVLYAVALAVSTMIAFATFALIELPFLRWRDRRFPPEPATRVAAARSPVTSWKATAR